MTLGYIVIHGDGTDWQKHPVVLGPDGILYRGSVATVFTSRSSAKRAISRSIKEGKKYKWSPEYQIFRLEQMPHVRRAG